MGTRNFSPSKWAFKYIISGVVPLIQETDLLWKLHLTLGTITSSRSDSSHVCTILSRTYVNNVDVEMSSSPINDIFCSTTIRSPQFDSHSLKHNNLNSSFSNATIITWLINTYFGFFIKAPVAPAPARSRNLDLRPQEMLSPQKSMCP